MPVSLLLAVAMLDMSGLPAHADEVVEARKGAAVRAAPDKKAVQRGGVVKGARFNVLERKAGKGCKQDWLRIAAVAWVCGDQFKASKETPGGAKLPRVPENELTPYEYVTGHDLTLYPTVDDAVAGTNGKVTVGKRGYKVLKKVKKGGQRYVKTEEGFLSLADAQLAKPSTWQGALLDEQTRFPLGFIAVEPAGRLYDANGKKYKGTAPVTIRQVLSALPPAVKLPNGKQAHLVGTDAYLDASAITVVDKTTRPETVGAAEHWLDVSILGQYLVAYEGDRPIYATLVSTAHNTPRGLQRIEQKRPHPTLESTAKYSDKNKYHYEVPWVMDLAGRYALHSAYWHDKFGDNQGNGCVNLAPRDAAYLWDFTEPALPPGWSYATAVDEDGARGTPVLIRD